MIGLQSQTVQYTADLWSFLGISLSLFPLVKHGHQAFTKTRLISR